MNDEDAAARSSEGDGSKEQSKSNSGCGGCLFTLIVIILTVYCSFDKSDFHLMPGEANLWMDAMEEVFKNLDEITPDSLEVFDELDVVDFSDDYINKHNIIYGVKPLIRVRSKDIPNETYLMRVIGIVRHTGPDEFEIRKLEMDTLINIGQYLKSKEVEKEVAN